MKKKVQGGAKTTKQLSDPVLLIDTTEYWELPLNCIFDDVYIVR